MLIETEMGESMYDVIWRTGCTFTILVLLVLLGSGRPLETPNAVPTPSSGGEGTRSAIYEAGAAAQGAAFTAPAGHEEESGPCALKETRQPAARAGHPARQPAGRAEICR
jgi:hypothetical protein